MFRIIVFGAQKITIDILEYLKDIKDIQISTVITSDYPRDLIFSNYLVYNYCLEKQIPICKEISYDEVKHINPDLIVSSYYRKILSKELIEFPKYGSINLHPSLLPKYRGCVPNYWSILNGEEKAGITLHYIDVGIDTGDIIDQKYINICEKTGAELHLELMNLGVCLFKENICKILNKQNNRVKQNHSWATYFGPYRTSFRYINWNDASSYILRHIRAHKIPFEGSTTWNKYCEIRIDTAEIINDNGWCSGKYEYDGENLIIQSRDKKIISKEFKVLSGELKKTGLFISGVKI